MAPIILGETSVPPMAPRTRTVSGSRALRQAPEEEARHVVVLRDRAPESVRVRRRELGEQEQHRERAVRSNPR